MHNNQDTDEKHISDSINRYKAVNPKDKNWAPYVFSMNTFFNGLNLWVVLLWLKFFNILSLDLYSIQVFPLEIPNNLFTFFVFALPFAIMNYFLIFYKNRYKMILNKYPITDTNYFMTYTFSTVFVTIFSLLLYLILTS